MTKITLFIVAFTLTTTVMLPLKSVRASSYVVTASVPYPAPTTPSAIDTKFNNLVTAKNTLQISGTCQVIAPPSVVSVWRGASSLGSTSCQANGTFSINIPLLKGPNSLFIRTTSLSNVNGPDSASFQVTYTPQVTSGGQQPSNPSSETASGDTPASSDTSSQAKPLTITNARVFEVLDSSNSVTVHIKIAGGKNPYIIELNWGDGSTDKKTVGGVGTYAFSHRYEKAGSYQATAIVTDVLGTSTTQQFLISALPPAQNGNGDNTTSQEKTSVKSSDTFRIVAAVALLTMVIGGVGIVSYSLGQTRMYNSLKKSRPSSRLRPSPGPKPRSKP